MIFGYGLFGNTKIIGYTLWDSHLRSFFRHPFMNLQMLVRKFKSTNVTTPIIFIGKTSGFTIVT